MRSDLTRRHFGALVALSAFANQRAWAVNSIELPARRVIALDWGIAETLVGLGHPPLGAAEIPNYNRTILTPAMPPGVVDVGLRLAPNPELMRSLEPDLVLINPAQKYMVPSLAPFGTIEIVPIYTDAREPFRLSCEAAATLAARLGDPSSATRLLTEVDQVIADARARLRFYDGRPVYVLQFLDGQHVSVMGRTSLFQGVFERLGVRNAYDGASNDWGIALIGIEALAAQPDARVLYFGPLSEGAKRTVTSNPLWLRLPFVREGRVIGLPPIWIFGALPTAMHFARMLGDALAQPGVAHD